MAQIEQLAQRVRLVCAGMAGDVPSPCMSVCRMDPATQWCEGCFRTIDEIAAWSRLNDEAKRRVWHSIGERLGEQAGTQQDTCSQEAGKAYGNAGEQA